MFDYLKVLDVSYFRFASNFNGNNSTTRTIIESFANHGMSESAQVT